MQTPSHAQKVPLGEVVITRGFPSGLTPTINNADPKGRTPPCCVYCCLISAKRRVIVSTRTGSSYVNR